MKKKIQELFGPTKSGKNEYLGKVPLMINNKIINPNKIIDLDDYHLESLYRDNVTINIIEGKDGINYLSPIYSS